MAERTSGEWMSEYVRLQQELVRVTEWAQEGGLTEDQTAARMKAAQEVFAEALNVLNKAMETWVQEFKVGRR